MAVDKRKIGFCESNKCSLLMLFLVSGAIAAIVCVTLLVKDLRDVYDHGESGQSLKWWQTTIIYQIYPRSFQDSDGDGVGDLQGIISRLDYFKYINVGAIWLSPFFESPMRDFGYDVKNYTAVDKLFGTMSDFDELIKTAKEKGIKVIIDFVPNHTSNESEWFQRSINAKDDTDPYWDFYIWNTGKRYPNGTREPPNNWQSVFEGSAWEYDSTRDAYYYHAFLKSQPDLNYRNPKVLEKVEDVIRFWMDKGVDGLRIDAIPHLFEIENQTVNEPPGPTNGFNPNLHKYTKNQPEIFGVLKQWREIIDEYEGNRFLLAETVGIPHDARMEYYKAGSVPFYFDLIEAQQRCKSTATCLQQLIQYGMNISGEWPNFVIGNHDNKRIADRIGPQFTDAMNLMLLTLPGTPTTYYGEELGMKGGNYKGMPPQDPYAVTSNDPEKSRDSERNPMQWNSSVNAGFTSGTPWLPITANTDSEHVNVEVMKNSNTSSLNLYKRLAEIRQLPAFQTTNIEFPEVTNQALIYKRYDSSTSYVVAINVGSTKYGINLSINDVTEGIQIFSTKSVIEQTMDLQNIQLDSGEGVIVRID